VKRAEYRSRSGRLFAVFAAAAAGCFVADAVWPGLFVIEASGLAVLRLVGIVASILAGAELFSFATQKVLERRHKPPIEGMMVRRIYVLLAVLAVLMVIVYGLGHLGAFGSFFAMFGGMLLGWSLQAPVSGFAAYLLVSLKRPFRPGDRVQFPNLGLTGDVQDIGPMYTVLDQVGGSVGSEEAVGRYILVPNAMLFSQVVINYTVQQEAPYILDEVVVRITYDSDWESAERILIDAATHVTSDIIESTGQKPYIRSDFWDYGILMRLRYQTRVKDRAEIAYKINKRIFEMIQRTPCVDLAIPFIYSFRAGVDRKEAEGPHNGYPEIQQIEIDHVQCSQEGLDPKAVEGVAKSIAAQGLLQPIVVLKRPEGGVYEVLAGHLRFEACRKLGWKTIPAVVKGSDRNDRAR